MLDVAHLSEHKLFKPVKLWMSCLVSDSVGLNMHYESVTGRPAHVNAQYGPILCCITLSTA